MACGSRGADVVNGNTSVGQGLVVGEDVELTALKVIKEVLNA